MEFDSPLSFGGVFALDQIWCGLGFDALVHREHIMVDGGSTDGTVALLEQHCGHLARWVSEPNRGIYDCILRLFLQPGSKAIYLPEVLVKMRLGGASNRSLANIMLTSQEDLRALRRSGVGGWGALVAKNLSKLPQFFAKRV